MTEAEMLRELYRICLDNASLGLMSGRDLDVIDAINDWLIETKWVWTPERGWHHDPNAWNGCCDRHPRKELPHEEAAAR